MFVCVCGAIPYRPPWLGLPTVYAFEARHGGLIFYILISLPFYHYIDSIKNCPCFRLGFFSQF